MDGPRFSLGNCEVLYIFYFRGRMCEAAAANSSLVLFQIITRVLLISSKL